MPDWTLSPHAIGALFAMGFATSAGAQTTDTPTSITSEALRRQTPDAWRALDERTRDQLLPGRRKGTARAAIIDSLEAIPTWFVHDGDLRVSTTLHNGDALIVLGDLTIDGSYNDDTDVGYGQLIVMGDLRVEHVVNWGALHVDRDLHATGVVHAYYNDFTFEVVGTLASKLLVIDDKSSRWGALDTEAFLHLREGSTSASEAKALQMLRPELIEFGRLDEGAFHELWPSYDQLRRHVMIGLPVLRDPSSDQRLIEHITLLLNPQTTPHQVDAVVFEDLLLTHLAAYWREDLTVETLGTMIATAHPLVLQALAHDNPSVPKRWRKRASKALETTR